MTAFTLDAYRGLIADLTGKGYRIADFHDADPTRQDLILRHDLDFSIRTALPMARIEAEHGWKATYFVLARSPMYGIHTPDSSEALSQILGLGHEVGLHFDASNYANDRDALETAAGREAALLEDAIGKPVRTVSFHRPAESLLGYDAPLAGRVHAYQPRYFREMGYCSDSRGAWHHGTPQDHPAVAARTALQLLTHPIWWTSETPGDPVATLDAFRTGRDRQLARAIADNCEPYRNRVDRAE